MSENKTALITGSTSGIGLGIARVLAEANYNIVLHGLVPIAEGLKLAQEFRDSYGIKAMFHDANMQDSVAIGQMCSEIHTQIGDVDVLVNNAGIQHTAPIEDFPVEKWNSIIAVNLTSAFHVIQKMLPVMQTKGWGRIINIASVHGLVGSVNKSAYVAAKHGMVGLTKVVALENASKGITVNAICPGWVETDLITNQINDVATAQRIDIKQAKFNLITTKQPMPKMAKPSHIGELVLFLCSDAAQNITGTTMPIDGGWTAQ
jgi:3-hydroxybutyrate dehydrogenase